MVWYPGKLIKERTEARSEPEPAPPEPPEHNSSEARDRQNEKGGWYPGKLLDEVSAVRKERREVEAAGGQYLASGLTGLRKRWERKRALAACELRHPIGQVRVTVRNLKTGVTNRPYVIMAIDGNEARTSTAVTADPGWPEDEFSLPVQSPFANLSVLLFDDESVWNEECVGRVIVPLSQ